MYLLCVCVYMCSVKYLYYIVSKLIFQLIGSPEVAYISRETPMVLYLNTHIAVDQVRHRASREGKMGPRV